MRLQVGPADDAVVAEIALCRKTWHHFVHEDHDKIDKQIDRYMDNRYIDRQRREEKKLCTIKKRIISACFPCEA